MEFACTDVASKRKAGMADPAIYSAHSRFQEEERTYHDFSRKLKAAEKEYEEVFGKLSGF